MRDKFEEYIRNNREEFDFHEPKSGLWKEIEKSVSVRKTLRWRFYLSRAAAVIIIFTASFIAQRVWINSKQKVAQKEAEVEINIPELREAEIYYTSMINAKLEEVKPLLSKYPSLEEELQTDLSELDSIYEGLKDDLKDNIANHEVIEAMIQNYRLRIAILEDMLLFLDQEDEENNTNNIERI
jgi:hypothetical protein